MRSQRCFQYVLVVSSVSILGLILFLDKRLLSSTNPSTTNSLTSLFRSRFLSKALLSSWHTDDDDDDDDDNHHDHINKRKHERLIEYLTSINNYVYFVGDVANEVTSIVNTNPCKYDKEKGPRILCAIFTTMHSHKTRMKAIHDTWSKR